MSQFPYPNPIKLLSRAGKENKGEYLNAEKSFTEAIQIKSDYYDAIFNRGLAYIFSSRSIAGCADLQYCIDNGYEKANGIDPKAKIIV